MTRLLQRISVPFEYPVYFTHDLFSTANDDLIEALSSREPERRHRVLVVIDAAVAATWPALQTDIARYADRHTDRMQLAAPPLVLTGGEECKNDAKLVPSLYA